MGEPPHDVPVRVSRLDGRLVALLLTVAVGLMLVLCALSVLAALLVSGLVEVGWRAPDDGGGLVAVLAWRGL